MALGPKSCMTVLLISLEQKEILQSMLRRHTDQNITHNSPSNILWICDLFQVVSKSIKCPDNTCQGDH